MTRPADRLRIAARSAQPDDRARAAPGRSLDHIVPARDRRPPADSHAPVLKPANVSEPDVDAVASNIVIFPTAGGAAESSAPTPEVAERPAPAAASRMSRVSLSALFVCLSLAVHGVAAAAFFLDNEKPAASIGEEVITVEVVLGADTFAGLEQTASQNEAAPSAPVKGEEEPDPKPEPVEKAEDKPVEKAEVTPEPVEDEPPPVPEEPFAETKPEEKPTASDAEALAVAVPQPRPDDAPRVMETKPVERKIDRKPVKRTTERKRVRAAAHSPASPSASSGVGRGSSTSIANYKGHVYAHLARHKNAPEGVGRGVATINFTIASSGAVTGVSLVRSSGEARYDREAQAMPRRASPFPPPPGGRAMSFTVPIRFKQ